MRESVDIIETLEEERKFSTQYKLSSYLIFSEPIIKQNYRLVYSTITTTLTLLKNDLYIKITNDLFSELDEKTLINLINLKVIVPIDFNELEYIINENKEVIANQDLLYQVISPSANCQLGCDYCGQVHTKDTLDKNLNEKIIARISDNLKRKNYKKLGIGWFGAEPLMGLKNIRLLSSSLMKLAQDNDCEYVAKMVTNGLSLKKQLFFELAEKYKITSFEITLDGTEKHHDLRRHTKLKEKTFNLIFKNLKEIVTDERYDESKIAITIRCNVDSSNYKSTFDLIELLDKENILNKISFYTAAIHSWGNDAHLKSLSQDEYARFQIEEFFKLLEKRHNVTILPGIKRHIVCTSLNEHAEVFDAYGDVYNCTEVSQVPVYEHEEAYKVGKLYDEGYENNERPFSSWNDDILNGKVPCTTCRILPICGGACPKLWKENISPCPPIKYNIKERMLLEFSKNKNIYLK